MTILRRSSHNIRCWMTEKCHDNSPSIIQTSIKHRYQIYSAQFSKQCWIQQRQLVDFSLYSSKRFMIEVAPSSPCTEQAVTRLPLSRPWSAPREYLQQHGPYVQNLLQALRHFPKNNMKPNFYKNNAKHYEDILSHSSFA